MKKLYIIDTCTIVHHPQVLTTLKDCAIVLPITVLEELDKLKSKNDQAGKNARIACKLLSDLTEDKNPSQWFSLDSGSKFLIDSSEYHKDMNLGDPLYGDNRILACALHYHKACASTSYEAVFLTRDVNAKVRSRAYGVKSEHYEKDGLKSELPFSGIKHLDDSELINNLFQDGFIDPSLAPEMLPNEFLVLRDKEEETVGIARMKFQDLSIVEKQYPWDLSPKNPEQVCAVNLLMDPDVSLVTLIGAAGSGKAQPLDANILTPNGWVKMGELKIGDFVVGDDGKPTKVTGIFPQGEKEIYKVNMSDGSSTECCNDHLWTVKTSLDRDKHRPGITIPLSEIKNNLITKNNKRNYSIPMVSPVDFKEQEILLDPYVLGTLLGDGGMSQDSVYLTTNDDFILNKVSKLSAKHNSYFKRIKKDSITFRANRINRKEIGIKNILENMNLLGYKSNEKYIPKNYLFNTSDVRLKVLQGLMDTNGFISKNGMSTVFYTTSKQLSKDVQFIVQSFGGKGVICNKQTRFTHKGLKKDGLPSFAVHISLPPDIIPVSLPRKLERFVPRTKYIPTRYIDNVEFVGKKQAQCIMVDNQSHLYVTDDFIVTHNTLVSLAACLEMVINRSMYDKVVIYRPIQAVGADVGFLPGPQPLSAKVATPNGWTTMGEIKVGDKVISRDGSPTNVIGIFPKGKKKVYRVHTSDNTYTECCEDHLWLTQDKNEYKHNYPGKVRSTKQLMETLMRDGKPNHWLPRNGVVQYNSKDVPIDPYTLGALLGDGCTTNNISLCSNDPKILDRVEKVMSNNLTKRSKLGTIDSLNFITKPYNNKTSKQVKITDLTDNSFVVYESIGKALMKEQINRSTLHHRCNKNVTLNNKKYEFLESKTRWQNDIKNKIYNLGLLGKKSYEKFIPDIYKYNSKEVRIELIRGLMDTDGTIKKNGESSFTTTSLKMAEDIIEVVKSLGGNANLRSRNRIGKQTVVNNRILESKRISYEFNISLPKELNPFSLKRKAERYDQKFIFRPRITNIELVREDEVQCIRVDNPEHLYLTDNFIVTHNTLEEKLSPWMEAIYDSIEVLFKDSKEGKGGKNSKFKRQQKDWREDFQMYIEKGQVELNCMTHVRGRSLPNCIIFIDEVQNISKSEIKTLLTRAGENTKIILTGDIEQIDNPSLDATNNGLSYVLEKFKDYHIAGHVTLTRGERSELATIASEIL